MKTSEIAKFTSEFALKNWAKKNGMTFATSCCETEENYEHFANDLRRAGKAVVYCANFVGDVGALIAFNPSKK